jgi:hypothetical protein
LGAWSVTWLLCQVATLSAFLPPNCCAEHEAHAAGTEQCHDTTPADHCPMQATDGRACPMHAQASADDPHAAHRASTAAAPAADTLAAEEECRMRGTCDGPAVALSVLFSVPAVMPADQVGFVPPTAPFDAALIPTFAPDPLTSDTPPPRA